MVVVVALDTPVTRSESVRTDINIDNEDNEDRWKHVSMNKCVQKLCVCDRMSDSLCMRVRARKAGRSSQTKNLKIAAPGAAAPICRQTTPFKSIVAATDRCVHR